MLYASFLPMDNWDDVSLKGDVNYSTSCNENDSLYHSMQRDRVENPTMDIGDGKYKRITDLTIDELDANHDSSIPVIFYVEYACTYVTPQKASGTIVKVNEQNVAFVKFSEKHRTLLNAFIRKNPG
ncbi:hypothetical protein VNO78_07344 [Psophocarpus tetragonolobus]|uniref:Uncharacterized protein n=1 Tax=Psophocarpus tetragonolobus TaxID=3891 RepID=A0AAN9SU27_PSOTE